MTMDAANRTSSLNAAKAAKNDELCQTHNRAKGNR